MTQETAAMLAGIALELYALADQEQTVQAVAEHARTAVRCDDVGILLVEGRSVETAAATSKTVRRADDIQRELGEGPCLSSIERGEDYLIADISRDTRWPRWAERALALGYRSMVSVRLATYERVIGSINLFSRSAAAFDGADESLAQVFATHASIAIAQARQEENLHRAIDSRRLIGQAQGILMERFDIDADRAFAVLDRYSQDHNVKLRTVAEQLVLTRRIPDAG